MPPRRRGWGRPAVKRGSRNRPSTKVGTPAGRARDPEHPTDSRCSEWRAWDSDLLPGVSEWREGSTDWGLAPQDRGHGQRLAPDRRVESKKGRGEAPAAHPG